VIVAPAEQSSETESKKGLNRFQFRHMSLSVATYHTLCPESFLHLFVTSPKTHCSCGSPIRSFLDDHTSGHISLTQWLRWYWPPDWGAAKRWERDRGQYKMEKTKYRVSHIIVGGEYSTVKGRGPGSPTDFHRKVNTNRGWGLPWTRRKAVRLILST